MMPGALSRAGGLPLLVRLKKSSKNDSHPEAYSAAKRYVIV